MSIEMTEFGPKAGSNISASSLMEGDTTITRGELYNMLKNNGISQDYYGRRLSALEGAEVCSGSTVILSLAGVIFLTIAFGMAIIITIAGGNALTTLNISGMLTLYGTTAAFGIIGMIGFIVASCIRHNHENKQLNENGVNKVLYNIRQKMQKQLKDAREPSNTSLQEKCGMIK